MAVTSCKQQQSSPGTQLQVDLDWGKLRTGKLLGAICKNSIQFYLVTAL